VVHGRTRFARARSSRICFVERTAGSLGSPKVLPIQLAIIVGNRMKGVPPLIKQVDLSEPLRCFENPHGSRERHAALGSVVAAEAGGTREAPWILRTGCEVE